MSRIVKNLFLLLLMVVASVCAYVAKPPTYMATVSPRASLTSELPAVIQNWKKLPMDIATVVDPTRQAVLSYLYTETLAENFANDSNQRIMLSIAYGKDQSDGHDVHKPDLCYPAQGFTILEQRGMTLELDTNHRINVQYLKTQNGERIEPLIYWTTAGDFVYQSRWQKKLIAFDYAKYKLIPDGMIVRVSTIEADDAVAMKEISEFVRDWYAAMPAAQRKRYFGTTNS